MDRMGIKLTFIEEINFSMAIFFMNLISPSVFLSDAYILFFLKSKKLNNIQASAIVISQEMVSQVAMLFFSLPSFIYVSCYANDIINSAYALSYAMMIIGLGIDLFALSLTFILGKSTRAQFAIAIAFN
jgi:hypothetical protein